MALLNFFSQLLVNATMPKSILDKIQGPDDIQTIYLQTKLRSESSCQRSILEICSATMSDSERRDVVGSQEDDLFKILRKKQIWISKTEKVELTVCDHMVGQKWIRVTKQGQRQTVNALFRIITANPQAFLNLLADGGSDGVQESAVET